MVTNQYAVNLLIAIHLCITLALQSKWNKVIPEISAINFSRANNVLECDAFKIKLTVADINLRQLPDYVVFSDFFSGLPCPEIMKKYLCLILIVS